MAKLINFNDKGKWGYYNSETHTIIPAQFQEDSDFVNGFAIVKHYSNSCYGVIDEAGKEILPFIFSSLERQGNGLFKAGSYYFSCLYSNKGEIVDANGIALDKRYQEYDVVKPFRNDMYLYKKGNISGVMYNKKVIVEKKDDYNFYLEIEQYPSVFKLKDNTGSFTYYDYHGQQILPEALELNIVSVNYIIFYAGYNKGKGIANVKGEILLTANYDEITYISADLFTLNYHKNNVKYDAKKNSFIVKDGVKEVVVPKSMDWCGDFENGKAIVAINHKYGIIDSNFVFFVPCDFDRLKLDNNFVIAEADGKCHLLDYSNAKKIATYDDISHLSYNYFLFRKDGCYGVIDNDGSIIIQPYYNKNIELLNDGNFKVSRNSFEKNYCIIDKESRIIVLTSKGLYHLEREIIWVNNFSEGLAIAENSQGLKGAIDEQGNIVIPLQFKGNLSDFHDGYTTHTYYDCGYKKERIDVIGQVVPPIKEEDISNLFSDGEYISIEKMCDNRFLVQRKEDKYYAIVDRKNNVILPFCAKKYVSVKKDRLGSNTDDNVLYFKYLDSYYNDDWDNETFFFDKSGNRVIPDSSGHVFISSKYGKTKSRFSDGLAAVSNEEGYWGFVNKLGKEVIPCLYDKVKNFSDGYSIVEKELKEGVIDKSGRCIILGDFKIDNFNDGLIYVTSNRFFQTEIFKTTDDYGNPCVEKEAIYERRKFNFNGDFVLSWHNELVYIPKEYEWCDKEFHEGFLSVCKSDKWGIINTRLEIVVGCVYDELFRFDKGITIAKSKNISSVINTFGQILFSGEYTDIKRYDEYNLFVCKSDQGYYDIYNGIGKLLFSSSTINSRIQIPGTSQMSSNSFNPSQIIPLDKNYMKFSAIAMYEKQRVIKWGICGIDGGLVLEACFDEIGGIGSGLVAVANVFTQNNQRKKLWGYTDIIGNVVIDYKYAYALPFSHGVAQVRYKNNLYQSGELGLIATNGKEITDFVYERFEEHSNGEMLAYYQYQNNSPILITEQGAIHYQYYEDGIYKDVYLYGYDWCSYIFHGLCIVMKGLRYGIIEASGAISFPLSEMGNVKIVVNPDGFVAFKKREVFKDVTKEGRIITCFDGNRIELPVGIHWCEEWIDGYIAVESNGKWGLLNKELVFVLETIYESIQYIGNKRCLCCLKEDDKDSYSIYNIETDNFLQLPYDECSHFENGCAVVSKVMKEIKHPWTNNVDRTYAYGLIDNTGQELLPCEYAKVQFKKPIKYASNNIDDYEEPYDWESGYLDAFEGDPEAIWGREW